MRIDITGSFNQKQTLWLAIAGLGVTLLVAGAFLPPFLASDWRPLIMAGYQKVCHQIPSRSFTVHGHQVALCHRCVGIWGAIPVAVALFALLRRWDAVLAARPGLTILASLVPLGLDWTGDFLGIWSNTTFSRLLTGSIFGLTAGYFLARVIVTSLRSRGTETNETPDPKTDSV